MYLFLCRKKISHCWDYQILDLYLSILAFLWSGVGKKFKL
uniref:Uncharacterized protein n=1 Tax=Manihot esculenta TaxID=3983 RepID=A0A2C9UVF0_MANES